jgi:hypothetical protein
MDLNGLVKEPGWRIARKNFFGPGLALIRHANEKKKHEESGIGLCRRKKAQRASRKQR